MVGMPLHPDRVDLEDEHDGAEPEECYEPSLGSRDQEVNQIAAWMDQMINYVIDSEVEL